MTTDNFCFYLQNSLIQTGQTGGHLYNDISPFSIPWTYAPSNFAAAAVAEEKGFVALPPGGLRRGGRRRERVRLQETNPHSADEADPDPGTLLIKSLIIL
jgi:hypothetical protein